MTDDEVAGEGPYVTFFLDDRFGWIVRDQSMTIRDGLDQSEAEILCAGMNEAFAAGRKAEREKLCESIISNIGRSMEALASIEHDRWARWHIYAKNNWTPENIIRWDRQAETKYQDLTEEEKEKDRQEVRNYLWVIKNAIISVGGEK